VRAKTLNTKRRGKITIDIPNRGKNTKTPMFMVIVVSEVQKATRHLCYPGQLEKLN